MATSQEPIEAPTFAATVTSAAVIAQQVAGKAIRDAFYLTNFDVKTLPRVMAVGAVLSLASVFLVSRALLRRSPRRLLPWVFLGSAMGLAFAWLLARILPGPAAVVVYLHTTVMSPILISTFWSHINERYDPFTAKRAVARIASGGTLGGVLGGVAAWRASSLLSLTNTILLLAALNMVCLAGVLLSRRQGPDPGARPTMVPDVAPTQELGAPIALLVRTPFLRNLGLLVVAGSAISSLLDYVFTAQATHEFGKGAHLLAFFSIFGLVVGVLSLIVQVAFGRIATEKLSLAMNIGFLPGVIVLGGAFGLVIPGLPSASVLRGGELLYRNSLFRSAYELLYTPVSASTKRATKAMVDVGLDRAGTVIGALLMAAAILTREPQRMSLAIVVVLAVATFPLIRKLHQGYVGALEQGLREGGEKLDSLAGSGTAPTLMSSEEEHAREKLQQTVAALGGAEPAPNGLTLEAMAAAPSLVTAATNLLSRDREVARAALASWGEAHWPLAALVIVRLADDALQVEARAALKRAAEVVVGQLVDALTGPRMEPIVRRRVARVLANCRSQRAADGLLLGLADPRFEVRYACARALLRVTDDNPDVVLSPEKVTETVLREVKQVVEQTEAMEAPSDEDDEDKTDERAILDWILRDRVSRNVEHVFTLLGLIVEREPLRMCLRALHNSDPRNRGTALEYLQTVLPGELRAAVWPLIGDTGILPTPRAASEVLTDLANVLAKKAELTDQAEPNESRS